MNDPKPNNLPQAVLQALMRGEKIDAIKLLRQMQGLDLKTALQAVEAVKAEAKRRSSPSAAPVATAVSAAPVATAAPAAAAAPVAPPDIQTTHAGRSDLAPGEVPSADWGALLPWAAGLAALALLLWQRLAG